MLRLDWQFFFEKIVFGNLLIFDGFFLGVNDKF